MHELAGVSELAGPLFEHVAESASFFFFEGVGFVACLFIGTFFVIAPVFLLVFDLICILLSININVKKMI